MQSILITIIKMINSNMFHLMWDHH